MANTANPYIGAAANIASGIFGYIGAKKQQQRQFAHNKEQQQEAYRQNLEQWQREVDYNDPSANMERLTKAGLNPNLVYGTGSATATAPPSPKKEAAKAEYFQPPLTAAPAIQQYQDMQLRNAQIEKIEADTQYVKSNTDVRRQDFYKTQWQALAAEWQVKGDFEEESGKEWINKSPMADKYRAEIKNAQARTKGVEASTEFQNYKNQLSKYGLTITDSEESRIIVAIAKRRGLKPNSIQNILAIKSIAKAVLQYLPSLQMGKAATRFSKGSSSLKNAQRKAKSITKQSWYKNQR